MGFILVDFETTGIAEDDYPIEIGMLAMDKHFVAISSFGRLIAWPELLPANGYNKDEAGAGQWGWEGRHKRAFDVHNINHISLADKGLDPADVVEQALAWIHSLGFKHAPTLVSDNIIFEHRMAKKLFGEDYPFHYHGFDIYNLLVMADLYNQRIEKPHRALPDCHLEYRELIRALQILGHFDRQGKDYLSKVFKQ